VSHKAARSNIDSAKVSNHPGSDLGHSFFPNQPHRQTEHVDALNVSGSRAEVLPRWTGRLVKGLVCGVMFVGIGCGQAETDPNQISQEKAKAQLEESLRAYPMPKPDTPEQIREKEAKVEATLPEVYEKLELARRDPTKIDEVVDLSMSLLTLVPDHRAAKVAYGKAQLASFYAKEVIDENGEMLDEHHMAVAIRLACLEMDRLRENFDDLTNDEEKLCQEVYFNRARMEGMYHSEPEEFITTINKLMSTDFNDVERLKSEPRFEYFFTDPKTAPVLKSAVEKLEGAEEEDADK